MKTRCTALAFVVFSACMPLLAPCADAQSFFRVAVLRGGGTRDFWEFDLDAQRWEILPDAPAPVGPGGAIAQLQRFGLVYALRGDGTTDFWQFTTTLQPGSNHWTALPATPAAVGAGGSLVGINYGSQDQRDRLYALQGGGSTAVWEYEVATGTWGHVADVPEPVGPGGAVTAPNRYFVPNGDRGFIDVLPGGGSNSVWSFNFAARTWTRLGTAPGAVSSGGALSNLPFQCDFAFAGGGSTTFFATGVLCDAPGILAAAPAPVGAGAGIAPALGLGGADSDAIYAVRGGSTRDFWRYRRSTNGWQVLAPAPHSIGDGGGVVQMTWVNGLPVAVANRSWSQVKVLFQ